MYVTKELDDNGQYTTYLGGLKARVDNNKKAKKSYGASVVRMLILSQKRI